MFAWLIFIRKEIKQYFISLIRLIYPSYCIFCDNALRLNECYSCHACISKFPALNSNVCRKCGMELAPYAPPQSRCASCRDIKTYYDHGVSFFRYENEIKTLLQHVKFSKKSWYLKILKTALSNAKLPMPLSEYDCIVPVPLEKNRLRDREFNQSEIIAKMIVQTKEKKSVKSILQKTKSTPPQSSLHRNERFYNLDKAFRVKNRADILGKKILVVDDVVTTGATINECARSLKEMGAKQVDFFSLARTTYSLN